MWRMSPCGFPPVAAGQYSRVSLWSMARMEQICNIFPESLTAVGWVFFQQLCKNQKIKTEIWTSCPARAEAGSGTYRSWPLAHPLYGSRNFIAWSQQHHQVEIPHDCGRGYNWHWSDLSYGFPPQKAQWKKLENHIMLATSVLCIDSELGFLFFLTKVKLMFVSIITGVLEISFRILATM